MPVTGGGSAVVVDGSVECTGCRVVADPGRIATAIATAAATTIVAATAEHGELRSRPPTRRAGTVGRRRLVRGGTLGERRSEPVLERQGEVAVIRSPSAASTVLAARAT